MILLDTDVMIDLLREYSPALAWLKTIANEEIVLSGYVVMELIQGCENKLEQKKMEKTLKKCRIVWPSEEFCHKALSIFSQYRLSHGIGLLDALIAQTSVSLGVPLHTFNQKHYMSIPDLITVQPYQK